MGTWTSRGATYLTRSTSWTYYRTSVVNGAVSPPIHHSPNVPASGLPLVRRWISYCRRTSLTFELLILDQSPDAAPGSTAPPDVHYHRVPAIGEGVLAGQKQHTGRLGRKNDAQLRGVVRKTFAPSQRGNRINMDRTRWVRAGGPSPGHIRLHRAHFPGRTLDAYRDLETDWSD
jgi:hypothetical protein